MRVAVFGGTGFVGSYVIEALLDEGHEPSLLVRPGNREKLPRGVDCRVVDGEVDTPSAVRATLEGCDALVYLVGILREFPRRGITFDRLHYRGVVDVVQAARDTGASRLLLMSANGVRPDGTPYQSTKFRAEEHAGSSGLDVTVFRPSVIFGDPRGRMEIATQLYRDMVRPPFPAAGFYIGIRPRDGQMLMSPVHVRDVAAAFLRALDDDTTIGRTFTLGGPEVLSWTEMIRRVGIATGKRKRILPFPLGPMRLAATLLDRLPIFPVTRDQLTMLAEGNTAGPGDLRSLVGREPAPFSVDNLAYLADA